MGNLGGDAEVKDLTNGKVINFSVALTENWTDKEGQKQSKTNWVRCSYFRTAEQSTAIVAYLKKGTKVLVAGKPEARAYVDSSTGKNLAAASLDVTVSEVHLAGNAPGTGSTTAAAGTEVAGTVAKPTSGTPGNKTTPPGTEPAATADGATDDLPF